jgi:hypothetical protein
MKRWIKYLVNKGFGIFQKRPQKNIFFENSEIIKLAIDFNIEIKEFQIPLNKVPFYPNHLPIDKINYFQSFESSGKVYILDCKEVDFVFQSNFLLDNNRNVWYQQDINFFELPLWRKFFRKPKKIKGTVAYLSNSNVSNYGHWMQYTLPLLYFYQQYFKLDDIDFYYIGDTDIKSFHIETLALLNIPKEKIVNYACYSERMICAIKFNPKLYDVARFNDIPSIEYLQELVKNTDEIINNSLSLKIYVLRGKVKYRKVIDEELIIKYLEQNGFTTVCMDGLTLQEQAAFFYNANYIIAPHGSALTNLIFCKEKTKIMELFPYNYPDWFNVSIAAVNRLDYYYLIGENVNHSNNPPIYNDLKLDMDKFQKLFNQFLM